MRAVLLSFVLTFGLAAAASAYQPAAAPSGPMAISPGAPVYAFQVPDRRIDINIGDRGGTVVWYRNPVWVAIGVIAIVLLLLIVVLALRSGGGGTTIIRE